MIVITLRLQRGQLFNSLTDKNWHCVWTPKSFLDQHIINMLGKCKKPPLNQCSFVKLNCCGGVLNAESWTLAGGRVGVGSISSTIGANCWEASSVQRRISWAGCTVSCASQYTVYICTYKAVCAVHCCSVQGVQRRLSWAGTAKAGASTLSSPPPPWLWHLWQCATTVYLKYHKTYFH